MDGACCAAGREERSRGWGRPGHGYEGGYGGGRNRPGLSQCDLRRESAAEDSDDELGEGAVSSVPSLCPEQCAFTDQSAD